MVSIISIVLYLAILCGLGLLIGWEYASQRRYLSAFTREENW